MRLPRPAEVGWLTHGRCAKPFFGGRETVQKHCRFN